MAKAAKSSLAEEVVAVLIAGAMLGVFIPAAPTTVPAHSPNPVALIRTPFMSSSSPAVGDVDGDGRPEVAFTSDNIGDITRQRTDPSNVNLVELFHWGESGFQPANGWPQATRDATLGLAVADLDGDKRDEVIAACGQDFTPPAMQKAGLWLVSRLYAWKGNGTPLSGWFPSDEGGLQGLVVGHAYASPVIADLNGDGHLEVLQASQGIWNGTAFERGSLRLWSPKGTVIASTQNASPAQPWYTEPGFAMDEPPVVADLNGDGKMEVVAATFGGKLYAWDNRGMPVRGWYPASGATTQTINGSLLRGSITAADIDGDGRDEILAGGYDGAMYCWKGTGALKWRTVPPAIANATPPLTSGVAVGRLRRGNAAERDIVAGDVAGNVTVWKQDGKILWRAHTTQGFPIEAEPAIGDVNGDGTQDVVIGGTDGYVYAFDGETGHLLWQVPTTYAPTPDGPRLESVFGAPALCDLAGNGHLNVVVATAQRYIVDVPTHTWAGFGHLMVWDCGPNTYSPSRLDWPQYRGGKARTGRAR